MNASGALVLAAGIVVGCEALTAPGPSISTSAWTLTMPRQVQLATAQGPDARGATWASGPKVDRASLVVRLVMPRNEGQDVADVVALATTLPGTRILVDEIVRLPLGEARHLVTTRGEEALPAHWFIFEGIGGDGSFREVGYLRTVGLREQDAAAIATSLTLVRH